jgi:hypothetical protein
VTIVQVVGLPRTPTNKNATRVAKVIIRIKKVNLCVTFAQEVNLVKLEAQHVINVFWVQYPE